MITISDGILTIPEDERFVGFIGDNLHTQKKFFIRSTPESGWLYRLYLTFDDGRHNFFTLTKEEVEEGTFLVWNIEEGQIFKSGLVKAQIKAFSDDSEVYHTTSDVFVAGKATEEDEEFLNSNSEFLGFEKRLNELYDKMDTATAKMPYVGTNGNWFTYDVNSGTYKDSGVSAMVSLDGVKITPENLDRDYWQKNSVIPAHGYDYFDAILNQSNAGNTITRVEFSGLSPVKSVVGKGSFIAVTSADLTYLLLFNLFNGESWRYDAGSNTLVNCGNTVVDLGVFVCWGDSENKGIIHTEFEEDVLYRFKLEGDFSECIGDNYCLGVYDAEDDSLRFINLLTGKYGRLSIDGHICSENENVDSVLSETSDNPVQNKVITKALKGKLNIVSITLPSGSNGDEELAEYLALAGTGYIGTVGGGKSFPFIFESYTAPNGIEVVEGLQAHVIQYKTYLKGPDAYKRYKRTYAHDGAEPIWSDWELVSGTDAVVDLGVFNYWNDPEDPSEGIGLRTYEFEEDVLYRFKLDGEFSEYIGDNYCLGVYDAEDDSLRFINLLTGKYGRLSIDGHICSENENVDSVLSETSDNPVQNKVITKALKGKLNIVSITLPSGSNGDEELAEYLALAGTGYIGTVGGGKSFPFIFESYTAPNGIEVVEGLQAHVIQYKTYLKGPDAYKRYKRTYAHDGAEPIWSEWELDVDNLAQKVEDIEARLDGVELVSWKSVQDIVRAGRAAEIFSVGDRLVCEHSEYGLLEWTVIGVDQDTPTDESLSHSLTLQLENAIPAVQFDAPEALFCINSALSAGAPYTFTANSTTLNFTPTVAVPAGAVAVFPYFDYTNITDTPLTIYETPADTEPLLTLSVNSGTLGSSLNATYNNVNRARYGSSNWMQSAIRQFLNSEAEAGSVWLPKNNYDRPPKWVNNTAGFLNGMDEDFLSVIGNVQKPTFVTPLDNGPAVFENTEKFFLPAVTEVFGSDYRTCELSEGESYTYYKVNSSNTSNSISADKNRIVYYNGEIAFCLLRSPHYQEEQKYQYRTCNINKKGGIDSIYSCHDFSSNDPNVVIKPCCCIV